MNNALEKAAAQLLEKCRSHGVKLVTAESCTGGLIAATLTQVPGSSDVFDCGFVTYSNSAKSKMLGIESSFICDHGAVSELVARRMAEAALENSCGDIAVAVTGIAGPGGGSDHNPVGTVHIAVAVTHGPTRHEKCSFGEKSRQMIRDNTVLRSFEIIDEALSAPVSA